MNARRRRLVIAALAAAAALRSARLAATGKVDPTEEQVFRMVNGAPDRLHLPVWFVMQSGSLAGVFVISGLAARRAPRGRGQARVAAVAGTAVWAVVKAVKPLVERGRPADHLVDVRVRGHAQSGLGYPSGHAAVSLTLALAVTHGRDPIERAAALLVAATTGWARMYVGAHLPLDVVGGFAVGAMSGQLAELALDARNRRR